MADVFPFEDLRTFSADEQRRMALERQRDVERQQALSAFNSRSRGGGTLIFEAGGDGGPSPRMSEPSAGRGTGLPGPMGAVLAGIPGMVKIATPSGLSEAEELELLELEAEEAKAAPPEDEAAPAPQPVSADWLTSLGRGLGQGATFGFGDEINGLIQALATSGGTFGDRYRQERDSFRRENDDAKRAHGGWYLGGTIAGGLPAAIASGGRLGPQATLAQIAGRGALAGGATGLASGLGGSDADLTQGEYLQAGKDAGLSGLLGLGLGAGIPAAGAALGWAGRNVVSPVAQFLRGGYVKPTPEAQRLGQAGVNLTLGQMNPRSAYGRTEELAAKTVLGGPLADARARASSQARDMLLKGAGAPGAAPPTVGAPVAQQLDELAAGFAKVYDDALGGARLQPEMYEGAGKWRGLITDPALKGAAKTKGAFELAAGARDIDASPAVRQRALSWLADKAQSLKPAKSGPNAGTVEARSIQALRTQLRDKIRSLGEEGDDRQLREIYGRAEEFVSELLHGQLPPDKSAALQAADTSYRNLLAAKDAAKRAFVQNEEFTPAQLLQAIRAKGATPGLESSARDAHGVLSASYPPTGVTAWAANIPGAKHVAPTLMGLNNTVPLLRNHALRQMYAPGLPARALSATGRALEGAAMTPRASMPAARTLQQLLSPPPTQPLASFATTEDELPPWAMAQETP